MFSAFPPACQSWPRPRTGGVVAATLLASLAACNRPLPPNILPPGEAAAPSQPARPQAPEAHKETAK